MLRKDIISLKTQILYQSHLRNTHYMSVERQPKPWPLSNVQFVLLFMQINKYSISGMFTEPAHCDLAVSKILTFCLIGIIHATTVHLANADSQQEGLLATIAHRDMLWKSPKNQLAKETELPGIDDPHFHCRLCSITHKKREALQSSLLWYTSNAHHHVWCNH